MTYTDELKAALYLADNSGFEHTAKVLSEWLDREMAKEKVTVRTCRGHIPGLARHKDDAMCVRSN